MAPTKPTKWSLSKNPPISNYGTIADARLTTITPQTPDGYLPLEVRSTITGVADLYYAIDTNGKVTYAQINTSLPANDPQRVFRQFNNIQEVANFIPTQGGTDYNFSTTELIKSTISNKLKARTEIIITKKITEPSPYAPPSGGTNPPAGSRTDGSTPSTTPEEQKALIDKISSAIQARTKYNSELLKYPEKYEGNDYLTITMIRYVPDTNLSIGPVAGAPEGESKTVSLGGLGALRPSERFGKNNEKKVTLATIDLPIPSNLLDGNLATWGNGDLNPFQAYGVGAFTRLMTSGGDILNQIGREGSTAANAVKGNADGIKTVALNSIISNILRQNPKELLSRSTGAVINPNQELLFLGPGLRTFSFSFKMTPRSEKEATSVRKIIRTLKQGMAVKRAVGGLFLAAPNVFELEFKYVPPQQNEDGSFDRGVTAVRHPYLPVLKVCALQNVSVNYMPDGSYMTYGDGSMVSYDMTLTFAELEPIFDTDYSELDKDTDKFIGY